MTRPHKPDEAQFQRLNERLREQAALLNQATDAILLLDLEDRILLWNKGAERIFGWKSAAALKRKSTALILRASREHTEAKNLLLANGHWNGELAMMTRDGRRLTIETRWTLLRDENGHPKSILAINTDVTEKKTFEAQSLRNQRMESLGTLASGIAHDLNNVLAPISIAVALLKLKLSDDKEGMRLLDALETNSHRGSRLVKQVLTFGRGVEGERLIVQLAHIAGEIEEIARDTFPKTIELDLHFVPNLWTVTGDPTQLHQVLLNLCLNARDAMPEGGKLVVSLDNVVLDATYAGMNPDAKPGPYLVATVTDTGTGIPSDIQDRIFEPFFTTKGLNKGTGLGLSTSQAIVKSHGGFIRVFSEVNRGTSFKVYLPANTAPPVAAETEGSQSGLLRGHNELVLVVDDEEPIRIVIEETLKQLGYRVVLAANGAEAVSLYAQLKDEIAVVITDIVMPIMGGLATMVALKTINPKVKIIGTTGVGSATATGKRRVIEAGVDQFIAKPFTAEALLLAIAKVLGRGRRLAAARPKGSSKTPFDPARPKGSSKAPFDPLAAGSGRKP